MTKYKFGLNLTSCVANIHTHTCIHISQMFSKMENLSVMYNHKTHSVLHTFLMCHCLQLITSFV